MRCIDELPIIAVLASQADGDTEIRDAGELRNKETDRIAVLETGLRRLGVSCESTPQTDRPWPGAARAAQLDAAGDHRFAMAWAIAGALVPTGGRRHGDRRRRRRRRLLSGLLHRPGRADGDRR